MKITPKQYAESLYQVIRGKEKKDTENAIVNFVNILIENNNVSKLDKIIEQFEKIWNKEERIVETEIISSEKLNSGVIKLLKDYIAKLSGAKNVIINEEKDKNILGGVVIKYEDRIIDGSLKTRIEDLKKSMVK